MITIINANTDLGVHVDGANLGPYELTKDLRGSYSFQKFKCIIDTAKYTIGKSNIIYEFELTSTIDIIECLNDQIDKIENEIESIMNQYNFKLLSIPGIGVLSAAVIISEYSDFSLFKGPNQLLSFAGMEPSISQSGTQSFTGHMVKRGSPHLRYVLMNVAVSMVAHNKVFSDYYYKKRNEGKHHRVALSHVVKKLLRIIYFLETNNKDFNADLIK